MTTARTYSPPGACPTCAHYLRVAALQCDECGTEVRGSFSRCEFCSLSEEQRTLLRVFLASRGNTKELERHLGVSYPTARARLEDLLDALGIETAPSRSEGRREVLDAVARGELAVDDALGSLRR